MGAHISSLSSGNPLDHVNTMLTGLSTMQKGLPKDSDPITDSFRFEKMDSTGTLSSKEACELLNSGKPIVIKEERTFVNRNPGDPSGEKSKIEFRNWADSEDKDIVASSDRWSSSKLSKTTSTVINNPDELESFYNIETHQPARNEVEKLGQMLDKIESHVGNPTHNMLTLTDSKGKPVSPLMAALMLKQGAAIKVETFTPFVTKSELGWNLSETSTIKTPEQAGKWTPAPNKPAVSKGDGWEMD
ncbi:MAG: hypothetical protein LWY06_17550 [Firmicutes bacterium]|nr:hypothetical protein [Bacillota bacterium]